MVAEGGGDPLGGADEGSERGSSRRDLLRRAAVVGAAGAAVWAAPAIVSIDAAGATTGATPINGCITRDRGVCNGTLTDYTVTNNCGARVVAVALGLGEVIDAGASIVISAPGRGPLLGPGLPVDFFAADANGQPVGVAFQSELFRNICSGIP
jgi:hypothetical protein